MATVGRRADHLTRLAEALGCSATDFRCGGGRFDGLGELIRLWDAIDTEGRHRVLAQARTVAAAQASAAPVERAAE